MSQKINLVFFYSQGSPYDNGLDLSENHDLVVLNAEHEVDNIFAYTPQKLHSLGYKDYVKEYPDSGLVSRNPGMSKIGFCAWRPLILLLELEKMSDGDILVYRDSNIKKYPILSDYDDFKNVVNSCLSCCGFDLFIAHHDIPISNKVLTKTNIIRELGGNHPFSYDFPALMSGFIAVRKSASSMELLHEWLVACEHEEWINGKQYGQLDPSFTHSTPEQAILSVIIANWIRNRKHNIPLQYPFISFYKSSLHNIKFHNNFNYLDHINPSKAVIVDTPLYMLNLSIEGLMDYIRRLFKKFISRKRQQFTKKINRLLPKK